jgi:hypothetical protein
MLERLNQIKVQFISGSGLKDTIVGTFIFFSSLRLFLLRAWLALI